MFKKSLLSLLLSAIVSVPLFATENEIFLRNKSGNETGSRSGDNVSASIDGHIITVLFTDVVASCVAVYATTESENALYFRNFRPASSVQADLTSLDSGEYLIEIYVLGNWWEGYFEID